MRIATAGHGASGHVERPIAVAGRKPRYDFQLDVMDGASLRDREPSHVVVCHPDVGLQAGGHLFRCGGARRGAHDDVALPAVQFAGEAPGNVVAAVLELRQHGSDRFAYLGVVAGGGFRGALEEVHRHGYLP